MREIHSEDGHARQGDDGFFEIRNQIESDGRLLLFLIDAYLEARPWIDGGEEVDVYRVPPALEEVDEEHQSKHYLVEHFDLIGELAQRKQRAVERDYVNHCLNVDVSVVDLLEGRNLVVNVLEHTVLEELVEADSEQDYSRVECRSSVDAVNVLLLFLSIEVTIFCNMAQVKCESASVLEGVGVGRGVGHVRGS